MKLPAVEDYLSGKGPLNDVSANYKIELKDYDPKGEVYMADAKRKTIIKERKEIVEYCINHEKNYKNTATRYDVSYSQVYSRAKKYDVNGEAALIDNVVVMKLMD